MAPPRRNLLPKDRFGLAFGGLKTQNYHDPAARGPGSHTYMPIRHITITAEKQNAY